MGGARREGRAVGRGDVRVWGELFVRQGGTLGILEI
jgi:hypothetical protein